MADLSGLVSNLATASAGPTNLLSLVSYQSGAWTAMSAVSSFGASASKDQPQQPTEERIGRSLLGFFLGGMMLNARFMSAVAQGSISQGSTARAAIQSVPAFKVAAPH